MAQKKIKFRLFLYPFSEIAAGKVPVWAKIKLLRCVLEKGEQKSSGFFRRTLLCQVPGKNYAGEEMGLCRVPRKKILEKRFICCQAAEKEQFFFKSSFLSPEYVV